MSSTSNILAGNQPKYTWWHGLGLGFMVELHQGHNKVISRSQEGDISSTPLKIVFFLFFATIMFTWDAYDGLKPT